MECHRLLTAIFMAFMLMFAGSGVQARLLRGAPEQASPLVAGSAGRALLKDAKDDSKAGDSWGSRDWPATRQVATTSLRGSGLGAVAAASSRSYGYTSSASPLLMSGAMNQPIMDSWGSSYRG